MISKHSVKIHQYLTWFLGWFVGQNSNKIFSFFSIRNQKYTAAVYIVQGSPQGAGHLFFMILRSNDIAS